MIRFVFSGASVIYKPRSGEGELAWCKLVEAINNRGFRPKLRAAQVICRRGYCWMEFVRTRPSTNARGERRYYQRLGATMALACIARAVDFHRDNIIRDGENPIVVDAEALWHTAGGDRLPWNQRLLDGGFFSRSNNSLHQSSVLFDATRIRRNDREELGCDVDWQSELVTGFTEACQAVGNPDATDSPLQVVLSRLPGLARRRIYRPTYTYDRILTTSLAAPMLRSEDCRNAFLARQCQCEAVSPSIIREEVRAIARADIPYFRFRPTASIQQRQDDFDAAPAALLETLAELRANLSM